MVNRFTPSIVAGLCAGLFAQSVHPIEVGIQLKGVVTSKTGRPITGAVVGLAIAGLKDTTGSDGTFSLDRVATSILPGQDPTRQGWILQGGVVSIPSRSSSAIDVEILDLSGRVVRSQRLQPVGAGAVRLDLARTGIHNEVLVVRATQDGIRSSIGPVAWIPGASSNRQGMTGIAMRSMAVVDSLRVSAAGFAATSLALEGYQQTLNVSLDSLGGNAGRSLGCGKAAALKSGTHTINVGGTSRQYILDVPTTYDQNHPYRVVFGFHWMGGTMTDVATGQTVTRDVWSYFGLKRLANNTTIFVAPQGIGNGWANTDNRDLLFVDAMVKEIKEGLCVDSTRLFANGFSYGGGMSLALACDRPGVFRAIGPQSGSLTLSGCKDGTKPFPVIAAAGTETYSSMLSAIQKFAKNNGCTAQTPPQPAAGSKTHICTEFKGCKPGFPVVWRPFDAGHIAAPTDGTTSDNGNKTWVPGEIWKFFSQF